MFIENMQEQKIRLRRSRIHPPQFFYKHSMPPASGIHSTQIHPHFLTSFALLCDLLCSTLRLKKLNAKNRQVQYAKFRKDEPRYVVIATNEAICLSFPDSLCATLRPTLPNFAVKTQNTEFSHFE